MVSNVAHAGEIKPFWAKQWWWMETQLENDGDLWSWLSKKKIISKHQAIAVMCLAHLRAFIQQTNTHKHIYYPSLVIKGHMVGKLSTLIESCRSLTFDLIWALTYFYDLRPHLAWRFSRSNYHTSLALKQACGWRVMDSIAEIAYLTSFDLWPTYMTFNPRILWRPV